MPESQTSETKQSGGGLVVPLFRLEEFFQGQLQGWGIQETRFGHVASRFIIEAEGRWDAGAQVLSLTETYRFDDGHVDVLSWSIKKESAESYVGTEKRLDGEAKGEHGEREFHWRYTRRVPDKSGEETTLAFDDSFVLIDERTMVATATVAKFHVTVGRISAFYRRM